MAIAFIILLGVYYAAQTYLIEEDVRYLDQPIGTTDTTPAQNVGDVVDTSGWKTYRNEEFGFEVWYPNQWVSLEIGHFGGLWQFSTSMEGMHGLTFPATRNNLWLDVVSGDCKKVHMTDGFEAKSYKYPSTNELVTELNKTVCKDRFIVTVGFWAKDPNFIENKKLLEKVLSTFTFFEPKK